MSENMTYAGVGVNYDAMDPFKLMCQRAGLETASNLKVEDGYQEFEPSRGESAYLLKTATGFLAHVQEGLGTKNLVADAMYKLKGKSYYDHVAQDTVAMIVNDMITLGARPLSLAMHLAAGHSDWFRDQQRAKDLVDGWKHACNLARCVWGGGETPTLKGIVNPETVEISGSGIGVIEPASHLIMGDKIRDCDAIILIHSSGIHANGLTLARGIADKLPNGYLTEVDGKTYGERLLEPTHIYVGLVQDCLDAGVEIHYAVNITGHGWRKLMRAPGNFAYVIDKLPQENPIFSFLQEYGPVADEEAYGNLNMGAGFALYVSMRDIDRVALIINKHNFGATLAGYVEESNTRKVIIGPKRIEFASETLAVR